jgi:multidrug resistance efflux pump
MDLQQAINSRGNLPAALVEYAGQDLRNEAAGLLAYARAAVLLAEARAALADLEPQVAEAAAGVEAAQAECDRANQAWASVRFQPDVDQTTIDESELTELRETWQQAETALGQAKGHLAPLSERAAKLAALVASLESIDKPATSALGLLREVLK